MIKLKMYALYHHNVLGSWDDPAYVPRKGDTVLVGDEADVPFVVDDVQVSWPTGHIASQVVDLIVSRPGKGM